MPFFRFYGQSAVDFAKKRLAEIRIRAILLDIEKASTTSRRRAGKRKEQKDPGQHPRPETGNELKMGPTDRGGERTGQNDTRQ